MASLLLWTCTAQLLLHMRTATGLPVSACNVEAPLLQTNILGGDLHHYPSPSIADCEQRCCNFTHISPSDRKQGRRNPRCSSWTFSEAQPHAVGSCPVNSTCCWLKTTVDRTHTAPKSDCTSGFIQRQPTPASHPSPRAPTPPPSPRAPTPSPPPPPPQSLDFARPLFADGMILQSGTSTAVWGNGVAGRNVVLTVTAYNGSVLCTTSTLADAHGNWMITLAALMPPLNSSIVRVTDGSESSELRDVAWGLVLLCGGREYWSIAHSCLFCCQSNPALVPYRVEHGLWDVRGQVFHANTGAGIGRPAATTTLLQCWIGTKRWQHRRPLATWSKMQDKRRRTLTDTRTGGQL